MKRYLIFLSILPLSLCSCNSNGTKSDELIDFTITPTINSDYCVANDDVSDYFHNYEPAYSTKYQGKGDNFENKGVELTWNKVDGATDYKITYGYKSDLSDGVDVLTKDTSIVIKDTFTNIKFYWSIKVLNNEKVIGHSSIYNFNIEASPRTITIDGVSNSRDMGGYTNQDGFRIKQGMIYRSATLDNVSDDGIKKARDTYKIAYDLDLRKSNEGKAGLGSPLGDKVSYLNNPGPYWIGDASGLDNPNNFAIMRKSLKVFADEKNYPVIFHCSLGQDRTGSLAYVLGALLGMSPEDLAMDYEMSTFSEAVGYKTNKIEIRDKFTYQYNPLVAYINKFGDMDYTLADKAEAYCLAVGLTDEEIESIRNIMIED